MTPIGLNHVPHFQEKGNMLYPASINCNCPYCGVKVNIRTESWSEIGALFSASKGLCSNCGKYPSFIMAKQETLGHHGKQVGHLYMSPSSRVKEPITDFVATDTTPREFIVDYVEIIGLYNGGYHNAASVQCRRLLEGILARLMPPTSTGKDNLYQRIKEIPKHIDTEKPFLDIANALREIGNLGAHYDPNGAPDRDSVEMTINLLEYFMEFIYILPEKIAITKEQIHRLRTAEQKPETPIENINGA